MAILQSKLMSNYVQDIQLIGLAGFCGRAKASTHGYDVAAAAGHIVAMAGRKKCYIYRHPEAGPAGLAKPDAMLRLQQRSYPEQVSSLTIFNAVQVGKLSSCHPMSRESLQMDLQDTVSVYKRPACVEVLCFEPLKIASETPQGFQPGPRMKESRKDWEIVPAVSSSCCTNFLIDSALTAAGHNAEGLRHAAGTATSPVAVYWSMAGQLCHHRADSRQCAG